MLEAKQWTNIDPKDSKIIALTTRMSDLDKCKRCVFVTVQGGGINRYQTQTNNKVSKHNIRYVEVLDNHESWHTKKSK